MKQYLIDLGAEDKGDHLELDIGNEYKLYWDGKLSLLYDMNYFLMPLPGIVDRKDLLQLIRFLNPTYFKK